MQPNNYIRLPWLYEICLPHESKLTVPVMSSTSLSHNPSSVQAQGKSKKKHKATKTTSTQDKDEGTNPDWDYVPPEGTVLADHEIDSGDFDWDSVKSNEDLEIWLVRIPEGVSVFRSTI